MNRSVLLSIILAIGAIAWVLSGALTQDEESVQASASDSADSPSRTAFKVRVSPRKAERVTDIVTLQGGIEALRSIEIKAETHGTIANLHAEKGQILNTGDPILQLAVSDREAQLDKARAELALRKVDLESGRKLRQKNLISENQHQQNIANVAAAQAAVKAIEVELEHTRIQAAFSGILNDLHVEEGDYVAAGDPIASLVDSSQVIITAEVPQQHIAKLSEGQAVTATLLDGSRILGKIYYVSSSANPDTRTFTIEARADNAVGLNRFGQSASVAIELGEHQAHKLSPSLLSLNSQGDLLVKAINENNRVTTHQVEILRSEADGIWLAGLPEEFKLITVGQGFVAAGDEVDAIIDEDSDATQQTEAQL